MAKKGKYIYEWPRPMVTADAVVFAVSAAKTEVLLIERKNEPFKGQWAVPGGFVETDEELEDAAARELAEETGLSISEPRISPDGHWLAVEVMQMSDLHVVRLFRREGDTLVPAQTNVTAVAWRSAATHYDIELDELAHARAQVAGWDSDAHTLSLALGATRPGVEQPFETIITVQLDQEP